MTNYKEKVDEIERHFRAAWKQTRHKTVQVPAYGLAWHETKQAIQSLIRTEKLKLLDELDKSIPTAEQLTTKYGYHMPEKQYGYKLALHDIREVLTKLEAER